MARMIPDDLEMGSADRTEKLVFELIRDETPKGWVGMHHIGLPWHPHKLTAEIDFVVVSTYGVFCLEVKGGAVTRRNGDWYAGSRRLRESPFAQVGSAAAALRPRAPVLRPYVYGYGCVFPHCRFELEGPEVEREVVYDESMAEDGFAGYIESLGRYWSGRYPKRSLLLGKDIRQVVEGLRGDYSVVESVMPAVREAGRRLASYTEEQERAIKGLSAEPRIIVRGGAGTGKTLLAMKEARRLAESGKKTLYTCFNKAVAAHVSNGVQVDGLKVQHLDGLISQLIKAGGTADQIPDDVGDEERFGVYLPIAAAEAVGKLGEDERFDAIVVDEGQDLITEGRLDLLDTLLRGGWRDGLWRVFWDPLQAIFSSGDTNLHHLHRTGAEPTTYLLTLNCRNTQPIADRVEDLSGIELGQDALVEGPEVSEVEWGDEKAEAKRVAATLREWVDRGLPPEEIVLLSPLRFENSTASRLRGLPAQVRDMSGQRPEPTPKKIAFSTIQAFKGLESEAVMLLDVDDLDSNRMRSLLYVGTSRARTILGVARSDATTPTFMSRIASRAGRPSGPRDGALTEL
jgi:hypothetical protein